MSATTWRAPQGRCLAGVDRIEITPPVGIYHRMWGAATHDRSTGVHRPLTATALALAPADSSGPPELVLIGVDHCLFWQDDMESLLASISAATGIDASRLVVLFSHTHGAGLMDRERTELPGGDLIPPYLDTLAVSLSAAVRQATERLAPATIVYGAARCGLATNRDYLDEQAGHPVCGFQPERPVDDTVLLAKIGCEATGKVLATVVNYACHPTTLAWDNTLISPDYVGATREVVERETGAPCLFIQGASGDIGPREGFVGDVAVADRNGRQLGHAALSGLEGLPAGGTQYSYAGPVVSGATIGVWRDEPWGEPTRAAASRWQAAEGQVDLPYREDLPDRERLLADSAHWSQVEEQARAAGNEPAARDARAMVERARRRLTRVRHLPGGAAYPYPLRLWRIGDAIWLLLGGEHYQALQTRLRAAFPRTPLIVGTLANGSNVWYVLDRDSYGQGLYQEEASILAQGALERLGDALETELRRLGA